MSLILAPFISILKSLLSYAEAWQDQCQLEDNPRSMFRVQYHVSPWTQLQRTNFKNIINDIAVSLYSNAFLQHAYYPVYVGKAISPAAPAPTPDELAPFLALFSQYRKAPHTIELVRVDDHASMSAQDPNKKYFMHINNSLAYGASDPLKSTAAFSYLALLGAMLHEFADSFESFLRTDVGKDSSPGLAKPTHQKVEERKDSGQSAERTTAEAGFFLENEVFGGILYYEGESGREVRDMSEIKGMFLCRGEDYFRIEPDVAIQFIIQLQSPDEPQEQLWVRVSRGIPQLQIVSPAVQSCIFRLMSNHSLPYPPVKYTHRLSGRKGLQFYERGPNMLSRKELEGTGLIKY